MRLFGQISMSSVISDPFRSGFCTLTKADSGHALRVPDDPQVGDQDSALVTGVALSVLDRVQLVNEDLPGAHLHLAEKICICLKLIRTVFGKSLIPRVV